ncbi:glycosyltransferase family 1 protein [Candidatus Woesearchaeota archaeon]|nr:MAG: 4-alpha-glucanotransferase [Candidatus Woesearchaeota archaeon ex4484_78]RLE46851.1 MAG: glycosyltransferase family 1 protein [Candidatus Woesearchaeota archaeon]
MTQHRPLRVLMFGWEFPPFKTGGLGTACHDLTKGLSRQGVEVTFVMPFVPENAEAKFVKIIGSNSIKNIKFKIINSPIVPYMTSKEYDDFIINHSKSNKKHVYGNDLFSEVFRYSEAAKIIAKSVPHDIIHVHDWMTYQAGINARAVSKKPLVVHLHATECDRTGNNPNLFISNIEYSGLSQADIVITNSNFTKNNIIREYHLPSDKIEVVHWGVDDLPKVKCSTPLKKDFKIVLFLGRITIQKGPDYFIRAAAKVLKYEPKTKFVIVGDGHMLPQIMELTVDLGIQDNVIFTGRLKGEDVFKAFKMADLYVMPSVSEPFGLVALESMKNNTPLIISKQSGVSEVVKHALKVDFWDVDELANKIVGVLRHPALRYELKENIKREVKKFDLDTPAKKTIDIYNKVLRGF